jgi:hypothetical protein
MRCEPPRKTVGDVSSAKLFVELDGEALSCSGLGYTLRLPAGRVIGDR